MERVVIQDVAVDIFYLKERVGSWQHEITTMQGKEN